MTAGGGYPSGPQEAKYTELHAATRLARQYNSYCRRRTAIQTQSFFHFTV